MSPPRPASPAVRVAALYRFAPLEDLPALRARLQDRCDQAGVKGILLLAPEGLNGTLAGPEAAIAEVVETLRALPGMAALSPKYAWCDAPPFHRMKVRVKEEIVTLGDPEIDPTRRVGTYVDPRRWDALLDDPGVVVLDTRNAYEVRIGTFEGAVDPGIDSFRDLPAWVKAHLDPSRTQRVAMFCTGGIRCEKASSLLLREGFAEVYHLEGGILRYLEETPPEASRWRGECFVFDQRVAVDARLRPGRHTLCHGCLEPISPEERASPDFEEGVVCPRCAGRTDEAARRARRERKRQVELAASRGEAHLGARIASSRPPAAPSATDGVLYSFRRCPFAMRARMALAAAGLDPELREVELKNKPAELLSTGRTTVPALVLPGGAVLGESLDIMEHALEHAPEAMARSAERGGLVDLVDRRFKPLLDRAKYPNRFPGEDTAEAWSKAADLLADVEASLAEGPFLDGTQPGFHDAAVFPFVRQFAGIDPARFSGEPGLARTERWRAAMAEHRWFRSVMKKLPPWRPGDRPRSFRASLVPPR